jgi:transcriptional regulator with XRE-family HTH domain
MGETSIIAKRLREARERVGGLSQKQLGIRAGINEFTASARMNFYERGTHKPNLLTLIRIGAVLQVPAAYFYCDDDELANLVLRFSMLPSSQKRRVIRFLEEL